MFCVHRIRFNLKINGLYIHLERVEQIEGAHVSAEAYQSMKMYEAKNIYSALHTVEAPPIRFANGISVQIPSVNYTDAL